MKVIAMYLPQFYRTKENDAWWGTGFTDWVSTRNAQPMFEGHYQPHRPLNDNYYNLLDKAVMIGQTELMHRYSVDGICMYHYWFENGRRILEKPAENLLDWKDIDMPFCFSWANETWARSWGNIKEANVWSNVNEPSVTSDKAILLNQNYGGREDWKVHFEYLLPFFRDSRYIKVDGKPLFHIYKSRLVDCLGEMLVYWRQLAKDNGLSGLYIIGSNCAGNERNYLDAELIAQPQAGSRILLEENFVDGIKRLDYSDVWNQIVNTPDNDNTLYGGFVGYDDTPRRGMEGVVIEGAEPRLFGEYLSRLMAKNAAGGNELIFLNAWNEWGEGMHLEPDQKNGYSFLEQIPYAKCNYKKISIEKKDCSSIEVDALKRRAEKFELYYNDIDLWLTLREEGINIATQLKKRSVETVAIYGFGITGRHLLYDLQNAELSCKYIVDRQKSKVHADLPVYTPDEKLPNVDLIIISSYFYMDEISKMLPYSSVSLGELIHAAYNEE